MPRTMPRDENDAEDDAENEDEERSPSKLTPPYPAIRKGWYS